MKITIFIAILCFIGYARSATRLSVYTSSDCSNTSRIGFINVPEGVPVFYPESDYRSIGCTPSSGGQYYDIQKGLDEFVLKPSPDWAYVLTGTFYAVGSDCVDIDETNALTYAVKPGVCMNYGPFAVSQADNSAYSFKVSSCGTGDVFFASGYGCSVQAITMQDNECIPDSVNSIYLGFFCPLAPAAPGAPPTPLTTAPTEPNSAPISGPSNGPAAVTTPAKASSASLTSFSIVGAAVAVFGLLL